MHRSAISRLAVRTAFWMIMLLLAGCTEEQTITRVAVQGEVTQKAGVVARGSISFLPAEGTEGPSATASIVDGKYLFDQSNGPVPGLYKVVITPQDGKKSLPKAGSQLVKNKSAEPWSGQADVTVDDNVKDFNLDEAIPGPAP